jgi:hypothetical protein
VCAVASLWRRSYRSAVTRQGHPGTGSWLQSSNPLAMASRRRGIHFARVGLSGVEPLTSRLSGLRRTPTSASQRQSKLAPLWHDSLCRDRDGRFFGSTIPPRSTVPRRIWL